MEQRLSTILAADLVPGGPSMAEERALLERMIREHDGRLHGNWDDRLIAEFASVVVAMRCALRLQQQLEKPQAGPGNNIGALRIGASLFNLGDGEAIPADAADFAQRLIALAEPGGICISGGIYDQIQGRLALRFDYLGENALAYGGRPVRLYRAWFDPATAAPRGPAAGGKLNLPAKPSIAVLRFFNMNGDPETEYFSDGITEDIIIELSRFRSLFVIARNSSFAYRSGSIDRQQVGRELGVQFLLEGSIRMAGKRVRVTAQLVDAATGQHLWAERYDRDLEDIFAVQDEVTQTIVSTLVGQLQDAGAEQAKRKRTENLAAYDYLLRGMEHLSRYTREDNAEARRLLERAVALDPDYALAHAGIASTYLYDWFCDADDRILTRAHRIAEKALGLDEDESWCHLVCGRVCLYQRAFARAEAHCEKAVALNPNDAHLAANMGLLYTYLGRPDEGIVWVNKAMRLNPHHPDWYCEHLGLALYAARRYAEASRTLQRISDAPVWIHAYLAACFAQMGDIPATQARTAKVLAMRPDFSIARSARSEPFMLEADMKHWTEGLLKAGLPA
ncbi:adenylate class-3/4/guanylyl cyclase [Rhodospirillaceae bacterium SYSU D60014]|uniref:adenylate class-3/4/guanylyl cyclase n=1 Tax=Virgifigura deserti TaxID=2268457 RepID=UPI000E65F77A